MNAEEKYYERVHQFLGNNMSEAEATSFQNELESNSELQEIFEFEYNLIQKVRNDSNAQLKNQFINLENKLASKNKTAPKSKVISLLPRIAIAASIGLLVGFFFFTGGDNTSNLFDDNYSAYPNTLVQIERGSNDASDLQKAFIDYDAGNFSEALNGFENLDMVGIDLYKAICYMEIEETDKALSLLNGMTFPKHQDFYNQVHWYKALGSIKLNKMDDAKKNLEALLSSDDDYRKSSATQLLEKLN